MCIQLIANIKTEERIMLLSKINYSKEIKI